MSILPRLIRKKVANVAAVYQGKRNFGGTLVIFAGLLLLGGCETAMSHIEDWSNIPERRKPKVSQAFYTHEVLFNTTEATLNESERKRLQMFINNARKDQSDKIYLVPGDKLFARLRVQAVADFLTSKNITVVPMPENIGVRVPSSGAIKVVVSRYAVTLPACPDWSGERFTYNNVPTSNWGCANAVNLGRMIARPEDLVLGRSLGAFDGEYGARSINMYRKGETKQLIKEGVGPIDAQQQPSSGAGG